MIQIMASCLTENKPLFEPMMAYFADAYTVYSRYIAVGGVQAMVPRYKWERDI